MKSIALTIFAGIAALSSASAALLTADRLLGSITPGTPSGDSAEVGYINFLLTETANGSGVLYGFNNSSDFSNNSDSITTGGQTYTLDPGPLVQPGAIVVSLVSKNETTQMAPFTLGAAPGAWLLAKYGGGQTDVFYIGNLGNQQIQVPSTSVASGKKQELSHYSLFNTTPTTGQIGHVPDGGATLILLGVALSGIGLPRRSTSKK